MHLGILFPYLSKFWGKAFALPETLNCTLLIWHGVDRRCIVQYAFCANGLPHLGRVLSSYYFFQSKLQRFCRNNGMAFRSSATTYVIMWKSEHHRVNPNYLDVLAMQNNIDENDRLQLSACFSSLKWHSSALASFSKKKIVCVSYIIFLWYDIIESRFMLQCKFPNSTVHETSTKCGFRNYAAIMIHCASLWILKLQ